MEEFGSLGWMPLQPKHLTYANAQFLLIGEAANELGKAVEATARDQKHEKETPQEEMEKLENEDEHRKETLKGTSTDHTTKVGIDALQGMTLFLRISASATRNILVSRRLGNVHSCVKSWCLPTMAPRIRNII